MSTLHDVIAALDAAYPPRLAMDWDAVGLVCGDPDDTVSRVLVAVDPTPETVDEAISSGAQLLVTHHPLLLRGVHGVGADTPKGALLHRLIRAGVALFTAHTNADVADPGVSDALAAALGLTVSGPLEPVPGPALDKIVTFVPVGPAIAAVHAALSDAGAGAIGNYSHCSFATAGTGQFLPSTAPPRSSGRSAAWSASRRPGWRWCCRGRDAVTSSPRCGPRTPTRNRPSTCWRWHRCRRRWGWAGSASSTTPSRSRRSPAGSPRRCPPPPGGARRRGRTVRSAGSRSAVAPGTRPWTPRPGPASTRSSPPTCVTTRVEHALAGTGPGGPTPALVDVAHWASEWPWCGQAAGVVAEALAGSVSVAVSQARTDPWTTAAPSSGSDTTAGQPEASA